MAGNNPRICCLKALQRWETSREFADEVLHETLQHAGLNGVNRSFVMETFYGVIRHRSYLDFVIHHFRSTGLDLPTRQVLRLGVYQLYKMRIPDHAAVYETVNIAGPARTLVNAILRRSIAQKDEVLDEIEHAPVYIRHSHPEFLWRRWEHEHGSHDAERLCAWNNQPARIFVRANRLRVTPGELQESLQEATPVPDHPDCLHVPHLPVSWINSGVVYVQDPSTLVACELLDPQPGETVLDACAAPGGKTGYMAQLMQNEGEIVACDYEPSRLHRLEHNLARLGVANASALHLDWLHGIPPFPLQHFDAVLIDAPCTNTGVIRRRTDVRWRLSPQDFGRMQRLQIRILEAVLPYVKPGGRVVYSTCSIERDENEEVVHQVLQHSPEFALTETRQVVPTRDEFDGAYAALMRRAV